MAGDNLEDVLAAIYLIGGNKWVDTETVARSLGVKTSSANISMEKLRAMDLIEESESYRQVKLTNAGENFAKEIRHKHEVVLRFLRDFLCIPDLVAENDAHSIEHVISDESLQKIVAFLQFIEASPDEYSQWFGKFKDMTCPVG